MDVIHIDANYISQTMQRMENVRAEVRRNVLATKQFTDADQAKLNAIFTDQALEAQSDMWREIAPLDHPEFRPNPPPSAYPIEEVRVANAQCIWFKTHPDDSAAMTGTDQGIRADVVLRSRAHDLSINASPWMIKHFAPVGFLDESQPCESMDDTKVVDG